MLVDGEAQQRRGEVGESESYGGKDVALFDKQLFEQPGYESRNHVAQKVAEQLGVIAQGRTFEADILLHPEPHTDGDQPRHSESRRVRRHDHKSEVDVLFGEQEIERSPETDRRNDPVDPPARQITKRLKRHQRAERPPVETVDETGQIFGYSHFA